MLRPETKKSPTHAAKARMGDFTNALLMRRFKGVARTNSLFIFYIEEADLHVELFNVEDEKTVGSRHTFEGSHN